MFRRRFLPALVTLVALLSAPGAVTQQTRWPDSPPPPPGQPGWVQILTPTEEAPPPPPPSLPEVKFSNFTSCPITDLQIYVPELARVEPPQDESELNALLDRIGAKAIEIASQTPNLISQESVVSQNGRTKTKQSFSYLVLKHSLGSDAMIFDEFRVDAAGEKFQTQFSDVESNTVPPGQSQSLKDVPIANPLPSTPTGPMSKGFVGAWLYFYPSNRRFLDFRYLGKVKLHHDSTLVFTFAQKLGSRSETTVEFAGTKYPVFLQGIAWVDPADFRIVRLRTDLLSVPSGLPMHQLTSDIEFAQFPIAELPSPLWLPRQVAVAAILAGDNLHEDHTYSNYRLFRARSKLVLK